MSQTREIPLTKGYVAVVDAADYEDLSRLKWYADVKYLPNGSVRTVYAARRAGRRTERMHGRLFPGVEQVDHRDGDGLNNTRANLRAANHALNGRNQRLRSDNTSGYKGVSWDKENCAWVAQIGVGARLDGCRVQFLGRFPTAKEAARAYDRAATERFGEFAALNFPGEVL